MKRQNGFSLIELLIVVVIIGIIAAIAVPNLLASRRSANEASAISTLRTYHQAQATYHSTSGGGRYAGVPFVTNAFLTLANAGIIDSTFATGQKSGYTFAGHADPPTPTTHPCHLGQAYPNSFTGITATGTRIFVIETRGVIFAGVYDGSAGWGPGTCDVNPVLVPIGD